MKLHGLRVGIRQSQRRACPSRRTNGAEEIGAFVALVGRLARSRSTPRPLPDAAILVADARFVLEPDFDGSIGRQIGEMGAQRA